MDKLLRTSNPGSLKMLSMIFTLLLLGLFSTSLLAAVCPAGDVTLNSQAQVDAFPAGCNTIPGDLDIRGADITDLSPLSELSTVGLGIGVYDNPALASLDGLSSLTSVGTWLYIVNNTVLANVDGLSGLISVGGDVTIRLNPVLINVDGLTALSTVGGRLHIYQNPLLSHLDGLSALTSVGGELAILESPSLTSVEGLSALTSVGTYVSILFNPLLTSLDGFSALIHVGLDVDIRGNSSLSACKSIAPLLDQIDDGLPGPGPGPAGIPDVGGNVVIGKNLEGCNAVEQVLEPAEVRINVTKVFSDKREDLVNVTLDCNDGFISQDGTADINGGDLIGHTFIVTDFRDGTMDCTVTESGNPDGYAVFPAEGCVFENVVSSQVQYDCMFYNAAKPANYSVTKDWTVANEGGNAVKEEVWVTIECDAPIDFPFSADPRKLAPPIPPPPYRKSGWLGDGDTLTASVYTYRGDARCKAYEDIVQSGVESENECADYETLSAGETYGCTIYNTVFFEGIPTLNRNGMALLVLMMLGMATVAFRRLN